MILKKQNLFVFATVLGLGLLLGVILLVITASRSNIPAKNSQSYEPSTSPGQGVYPSVTNTPQPSPTPTPPPSPDIETTQTTVKVFEKFEVTVNISKTTATNLQFPYDPNPPMGINPYSGISVDGLFSKDDWATTIVQPAFIYQDYDRTIIQDTEHFTPAPKKVWKIRFAPTSAGEYKYRVRIIDASGTRYLPSNSVYSFTALPADPTNHGFINVSQNDKRYFEFSDGTPFIGIGTNIQYFDQKGLVSGLSQYMDNLSQNNANFLRAWLSTASLYGSSWSPWSSPFLPYDGYIPANGLSYEDAYPGSQYSMKLDTTNPCLVQGNLNNISVEPAKQYHIMVRAKIVNLSQNGQGGGFNVKTGGGLDKSCNTSGKGTYLLSGLTKSNDWQEFEANFSTNPDQNFLDNLDLTLENVKGGAVFIDEVSIKQVLANGQLGPEIVEKGKAAQQLYYDDYAAKRWDLLIDKAQQDNVYLKLVIFEKNDFTWGHINPDGSLFASSLRQGDNNNFYAQPNTEVRRLQEYYWRYLTARWGYSTAIQSWELLNEGDPYNGNHYALTEAFAKYIKENDPNKHLATTSNWHSLPVNELWNNSSYPDVAYADAHSYANDTSWLSTSNFKDPITGINISDDSAIFSFAHSMDALQKFQNQPTKPVVLGEAGITHNGVKIGQNDTDSKGVWLHQLTWAGVNPGAIQYSLYWYIDSIKKYNLYPIFKVYANFMQGTPADSLNKRIPVNNGKYSDIKLTVPSDTLGWGQKDTTNGGAYFWLYDNRYNLNNPNGGSSVAGRTVSFEGLPPKTYTVEWWDTWTGQVVTQSKTLTGSTMTLTVPSQINEKDVAVKIYPAQTGYPTSTGK